MTRMSALQLEINNRKWQIYKSNARQRGQMVCHLLQSRLAIDGARILDYGCGEGGTATVLANAGARVDAVDLDEVQIAALKNAGSHIGGTLNAFRLDDYDFSRHAHTYDAAILQDTLEHLNDPRNALKALRSVLRDGGWLYLCTPNRLSVLNWLADPHYSLPLVALLPRPAVKKVVADLLHWRPPQKTDFPQLLSLQSLHRLLTTTGFSWRLLQREAFDYAMQNPSSLWNHPWHLSFAAKMHQIGIDRPLAALLHNHPDTLNTWLCPSWFVIARADRRCS